ncbi:MAG: hypothetical protein R3C40_04455 [Parvularculaceae bacterium]
MASVTDIGEAIEAASPGDGRRAMAQALLGAGEDILVLWLEAHGSEPTREPKEGFRLLALHRQGAKDDPSFNACRETCRELAYHYNIAVGDYEAHDPEKSLRMMRHIARHLYLFVSGKMQEAELGEFCCSSKSIRANGV